MVRPRTATDSPRVISNAVLHLAAVAAVVVQVQPTSIAWQH